MKINYTRTLLNLLLLVSIIFLNNCTTPKRLGESMNYSSSGYSSNDILVNISPLSKNDDYNYLETVKKNTANLIRNNASYEYIKSKYPNLKVNVNVSLDETKYRTWLLDAPFFYPMTGYWPVTPWWGKAKVSTSISFEIYNQDNAKFDFDIEEKYVIVFYPYYRAKKVITSKYQLAWNNLNSQLSVFDFAENWTGNKLKFNRVNETISNSNETATAPIKQNTVKKPKTDVPILSIDENIKLIDENNNQRIDGLEKCNLTFKVKNEGKGYAMNLRAVIVEKNNQGLAFQSSYNIGKIEPNSSKEVVLPFSGSLDLKSGISDIEISFLEQNNFQPDPIKMKISTHEFEKPLVKIVDYQFISEKGQIKLGYPIHLKAIVQNLGQGNAENVSIQIAYPESITSLNEEIINISNLPAGETQSIDFEFIANKTYRLLSIPLQINLNERFGKYSENKLVECKIDDKTAATSIDIISNATDVKKTIKEASLVAEVDKNIPINATKYPNRYALIIGNEDYSSHQTTVNTEIDVEYAINDATIFKEYATKTFGVEEENCFLITNATLGKMNSQINLVSQIISKLSEAGKECELIFYYAGHGLPDENTKVPYIIPVDISSSNITSAIKLTDIYSQFAKSGAKKITVFLDACFSGGGRESGLLAARGVKVKPRETEIDGNFVVFSASSGDQSALPYKDKQHGLFTYFLLKKLQDSQGKISYGELEKYIKSEVSVQSLKINGKSQDPQVNVSSISQLIWSTWRVE